MTWHSATLKAVLSDSEQYVIIRNCSRQYFSLERRRLPEGNQRNEGSIPFTRFRPLVPRARQRGNLPLILVRSVRLLCSSLRTELANQQVIPEQERIRLEADVLTIGLPRIDQNVNLVAITNFAS